jgi:hypothetical protein
VLATIALVLMTGYTLVAGVQVRRPGVALPGLACGGWSPWRGWRLLLVGAIVAAIVLMAAAVFVKG